jgi:hypothetical protein
LLKAGLLPDDIRPERIADDEERLVTIHVDAGISAEVLSSLHGTLAKFYKVRIVAGSLIAFSSVWRGSASVLDALAKSESRSASLV